MRTKILFTSLFIVTTICSNAQWTTSGNDIYNSNSGNVGIGNTSPDSKLVITRNNWQLKLTNPNSGSWDWRIGSSSNDWFSGGQRFVISHTVYSQDATFCIDGSTSNFNVGIGKISPSYKLDINGAARATVYYTTSDERLKKDILRINGSLDRITKLNAYSYTFNSNQTGYSLPKGKQIGFLAQQVEEEFPDLVTKDSEGMLAVNYSAMIPILVEAVKELKSDLESTKAELKEAKLLLESKSKLEKSDGKTFNIRSYPNPSNGISFFEYELADGLLSSTIVIKNLEGESVQVFENLRGSGKVEMNTTQMKKGLYVYSLIVGGEVVHSERMILN